jgi:hypothetical protein
MKIPVLLSFPQKVLVPLCGLNDHFSLLAFVLSTLGRFQKSVGAHRSYRPSVHRINFKFCATKKIIIFRHRHYDCNEINYLRKIRTKLEFSH